MTGISMDPFYYQSSIASFLEGADEVVLSQLTKADDHAEIKSTQRDVWADEIAALKEQLSGVDGNILFEYSIPRLGKRIDVVLIVGGVVFVLEFKGGDSTVSKSAIDQVWDYALDLKFFHEGSASAPIVPVLIPFAVKSSDLRFDRSKYHDEVYEPVVRRGIETVLLFTSDNPKIQIADIIKFIILTVSFERFLNTKTVESIFKNIKYQNKKFIVM